MNFQFPGRDCFLREERAKFCGRFTPTVSDQRAIGWNRPWPAVFQWDEAQAKRVRADCSDLNFDFASDDENARRCDSFRRGENAKRARGAHRFENLAAVVALLHSL